MQQVSLFVNGEFDYAKLVGDTGPIVYPAIHLYLYSILYYLTDHGTNIFKAQCIFGVVYLVTLSFVMACYRRAGAPTWLLFPLVLSKRLHSIFLLRLFNDTWATMCLWISIYGMQRRLWPLGALAYGFGLGIKMTLLLVAPSLAVILVQAVGASEAFFLGAFDFIIQTGVALPFLGPEYGYTYIARSFDFSRQFLHKWTVNWKFVPEEIFLSSSFSVTLVVAHLSLLLVFLQNRWIKPSSLSIREFVRKYTGSMPEAEEQRISNNITAKFVMDTVLSSLAIGMLCARSLHYQFYSYLGWATPYLLWTSGTPWYLVLILCGAQEYFWNVYPSNESSSAAVVMLLAMQVVAAFNVRLQQSTPRSRTEVKGHTE